MVSNSIVNVETLIICCKKPYRNVLSRYVIISFVNRVVTHCEIGHFRRTLVVEGCQSHGTIGRFFMGTGVNDLPVTNNPPDHHFNDGS